MGSRTVFVTGASAGFGEAIARRFAADGARVIVSARRSDRIAELAKELGSDVLPLTIDVRDRAAVADAVSGLPPEFAAIDVLVNNAGLALGLEPAYEASLDDWDAMIDTNCKGLAYCTRAVLPGMVERGHGHVINLGSIAGTYPYPGGNVYGTGVRVTSVEPGLSGGTEFSVVRFGGDRGKAGQVYEGVHPLEAGDVAEAVHWAASLPSHVNINVIEMMPVAQSFGPLAVARQGS
jgi:3-hydroxy acid dehydrogenase/malonic semialdehyde reductase